MVEHYSRNTEGRDFVCGDIHGEYRMLERALAQVRFDPARDRLFCVGDLVDRGPASREALDWLARPWFHACRGNHDEFVHTAVHNVDDLSWWVGVNGGDWWLGVDPPTRERFVEIFARLPLALEVETDAGLVGIVHADVPCGMPWAEFTARLAEDAELRQFALWSRQRARGLCTEPVPDVVRVYCGHTVFDDVARIANVWFIDTGAGYGFEGARLTLLPLAP
ncbi:metallophosphoesterase [Inmirania thermothiophila]|uniref:Serine/threonine protein phosphatase 1 n=1 Tax=Inmirania thermothiophila TaxID=1750597 RepID=A0A3N1Y1Y1_9GAMM|nr:metallophosphoesterase [Inmirania thermothiophila]ROR32819.1 serine/threonine protein phosphatase 1 [Inmirania thermothiophila]